MGYIREPKGVVFTVINKGLSDEERSALTAFIQKSKKKRNLKKCFQCQSQRNQI